MFFSFTSTCTTTKYKLLLGSELLQQIQYFHLNIFEFPNGRTTSNPQIMPSQQLIIANLLSSVDMENASLTMYQQVAGKSDIWLAFIPILLRFYIPFKNTQDWLTRIINQKPISDTVSGFGITYSIYKVSKVFELNDSLHLWS